MSLTEKLDRLQRVLNEATTFQGKLFVSTKETGKSLDGVAKRAITKDNIGDVRGFVKDVMSGMDSTEPWGDKSGHDAAIFGSAYVRKPVEEAFAGFLIKTVLQNSPSTIGTFFYDELDRFVSDTSKDEIVYTWKDIADHVVGYNLAHYMSKVGSSKTTKRLFRSMLDGYTEGDDEKLRSLKVNAAQVEKIVFNDVVDAFQYAVDTAFRNHILVFVDM